ncbi:helix-turn-helix transcriptional regulator [Streptomyces sp. UNOC14_S4]|uniref:helix-turn-helix domain-containing protein n=1 Tax=Streptomyces sp. UNOC14_S4 TaxID=2872340 RepID=UPI001E375FF8|nr:helix-turn-helix transcriptional regulator [Streptomyces sp. UNOC14_S4]MCC3771165.1 helix-turn-helix domain-containing protein [Streptomyces sp. UNOC14_S4]
MTVASTTGTLKARRALGKALRLLRDRRGLTTEDVSEHLGCHNSKVSRLENGKRACVKRDFDKLMELYEVDEPQRAELAQLMLKGRQRVPPWWQAYGDVISANYAEFIAYEAEADRCRECQSLYIPGLLQTSDYARAVTSRGVAALGPDQVDTLVEVRMRRQARLQDANPIALEALIHEAALHVPVGGVEVMRTQLQRLLELSRRDNVSIRVVPFSAGENGVTTGAFALFTAGKDGDDDDVAFVESAEAMTGFRDDPLAVKRLSRLFRNLSSSALTEQDSRELIERIEKELV